MSRPVKADVLRHHIQKAITDGDFWLLSSESDSDLPLKLDGDSETYKRCASYISTIQAVEKPEHKIYEPLAKLLTEVSRIVHCMQVKGSRTSALTATNSLIMFIPRATSVQEADDGEAIRPDIAGVEATAEEVVKYLEDGDLPDWISSLRWSQLVSVAEVKLANLPEQRKEADMLQLLSYVWCANRYQPNRFIHTALLAFKTGFMTLQYHPDSVAVSSSHPYSDIEGLVRYVYDVYYPGGTTSTPLEFTNLKPIPSSPHELKTNAVTTLLKPHFTYTVQGDDETVQYSIFDLFHGSGFGRQAYVGLGAKTTAGGRSPLIIVLKVYCRDAACRFKEEHIIQKIHRDGYLPGVPRICEDTQEQPFVLQGSHEQDPVWEACMISLATTGESLSTCKNVLQFLKAMYDLTEVHRILVERKHILHRDISWGNILINHRHFEGPDEDISGFGFIDNLLGESEPKVQVLLTDFDNATMIQEVGEGKHEHHGTKSDMHRSITGTPAFIAEVLARLGPERIKPNKIPWGDLQDLNDNVDAHPLEDRHNSDVEFFKEVASYKTFDPTHVSHQAIHDAESIFWIIVYFMIRANPKGSDSHKSISDRSKLFDAIMGHKIGSLYRSRALLFRFTVEEWMGVLPEELHSVSGALVSLSGYFSFPWHGIQVPVKHQFHAHNFLQRLLIAKIRQLTELKNPIQLELVPLPVRSELGWIQLTGDLKSLVFKSQRKRLHTEDVRAVKRRKLEPSQAEGDCAPSATTDVYTGEARDMVVASRVTSCEILQSIVRDPTARKVIEGVRTSQDIEKTWFTGSQRSHIAMRPLIKPPEAL
ncbi:hypothetical protein JB92DRAFT_3111299 [Gautieria morchelliformis]|nr:hypothetical protein JB92DRAFT_3111299 [Gautieria morchelliformis]